MENPYGLAALIKHGDAVTWAVLGLLLIMSLATWCIIFTKLWRPAAPGQVGEEHREEFLVGRLAPRGRRQAAHQ